MKIRQRPFPPYLQAERIDARTHSMAQIIAKASEVVDGLGIPLVISNFLDSIDWNSDMFTLNWLKNHYGSDQIVLREIKKQVDVNITLGQYIDHLSKTCASNLELPYGKDLNCPAEWTSYAAKKIPKEFWNKSENDLTAILPVELQPDNLMVYIGCHGTLTPGHTDICSSWGHNIMVYTSKNAYSEWFVIGNKDHQFARSMWASKFNNEFALEEEKSFMSEDDLSQAPFNVYYINQQFGDFVLVPPDAPHQVKNYGQVTIKIAWNRISERTVVKAYWEALPSYHKSERSEVYRIKTVVFHYIRDLLEKCSKDLFPKDIEEASSVLLVFSDIIYSECISKHERDSLAMPYDDDLNHTRSCDKCKCDIFNRAFHCGICGDAFSGYDLCVNCYAEGYSCSHVKLMILAEHFPPTDLIQLHDDCVKLFIEKFPNLKLNFLSPEIYINHLNNPMTRAFDRYFHVVYS